MNQMKKEELEITISDSDRIECAIRHIKTAVDVDPWAVEIAVKAMKTQLSAEGTTSDLISRQAAIDVCDNAIDLWHGQLGEGIVIAVKKKIEELLPAQPEIEERKEESAQNVPKEDLISRKAAIDAVENIDCSDGVGISALKCEAVGDVVTAIKALPSAQPEPQWIPVKERLPESKYEDLEYPTVIVCCGDGAVTLACYYESTKEWGTGEYYDRIINPVAWMPLPEPYRAERRTDE